MTRSQAPRYHFNPRSREGSDCIRQLKFLATVKFQSTLPRRERRVAVCARKLSAQFQSTLPRRERPSLNKTLMRFIRISIHAPAKGATILPESPFLAFLFQSTLPRRERQTFILPEFCYFLYFNPRSREGSDIIIIAFQFLFVISIHAPAKGATSFQIFFQKTFSFQSTLPRRERPMLTEWINFNHGISIHAPAKGATL